MKNIFIITTLLFLHGNLVASQSMTQIENIKSESDNESSLISVFFKGKILEKNIGIEEHGTFIQVKIKNATALETGKFYEGNSPFYRKIAIFQINSQNAGVRLFVTQETSSLIDSISTKILKDRVLILLDHKTVKATSLTSEKEQSNKAILSKKEKNDEKDAKLHVSEALGAKAISKASLKEKLIYTSVISGIFLMLGFCVLIAKRLIPRVSSKGGEVIVSPMKTLATHPLAPKQNLTLVEVASQKILLAVSPEGINYLTTIEDKKEHQYNSQNIAVQNHVMRRVEQRSTPELNKTLSPLERTTANNIESVAERVLNKNSTSDTGVQAKIDSIKKEPSRSIEDVTNLIRSKLKDLPTV